MENSHNYQLCFSNTLTLSVRKMVIHIVNILQQDVQSMFDHFVDSRC